MLQQWAYFWVDVVIVVCELLARCKLSILYIINRNPLDKHIYLRITIFIYLIENLSFLKKTILYFFLYLKFTLSFSFSYLDLFLFFFGKTIKIDSRLSPKNETDCRLDQISLNQNRICFKLNINIYSFRFTIF